MSYEQYSSASNACGEMRQDPLDENELAKFKALKSFKPERLNAMLPSWIKKHQRAIALPKQFKFIPNEPPQYPHRLFTIQREQEFKFPEYYYAINNDVKGYIEAFEQKNCLVHVDHVFIQPMQEAA